MGKFKKLIVILLFLLISSFFLVSLLKTPNSVRSQTTHIVISEIQVSGTSADDEFVELYNPTGTDVDISGWSIQRETTTGTFAKKNFEAGDMVSAQGYFLVAHSSYDDATVPADMTHSTFSLSSTNGGTVFLVNDQVDLSTGDETTIVDKVAIGTSALDPETSPFSTIPVANESVERKPGASDAQGGNDQDTNNNAEDFATRGVSEPQNTTSAKEPPEVTPTDVPTPVPTDEPTPIPTEEPTPIPTEEPTPIPIGEPTPIPTGEPTPIPTEEPTPIPTEEPTPIPTEEPTPIPIGEPTPIPTEEPTPEPTGEPTPILTPIPSPSPTPEGRVIGIFGFGSKKTVCKLNFKVASFGFLKFLIPSISCNKTTPPPPSPTL